jgi:RimJ/RimL family protein N-acetyltransferase
MIDHVDTYLDTERLALRRFTADDADLLIELDSDPAVMRYLSGGEPTAPEVVRERYVPNILAGYEKWGGELGLFAAHEKDGGAFIGWFILRPESARWTKSNSATGFGRRPGARAMPPKARGAC